MSAERFVCRYKPNILPFSYVIIALFPIFMAGLGVRGLTSYGKGHDIIGLPLAVLFGIPAFLYVKDLARIRKSSVVVDSQRGVLVFSLFRFSSSSFLPGDTQNEVEIRFDQISRFNNFPSGNSGIGGIDVWTEIGRVRIWDSIDRFQDMVSILQETIRSNAARSGEFAGSKSTTAWYSWLVLAVGISGVFFGAWKLLHLR
jgi:hypothetical protein